MAQTSIYAGPGKPMLDNAIKHFKLEGIVGNEDGTFGISKDNDERTKLLSQLTGLMLANYVEETMVLPSNVNRLREVVTELSGITGIDEDLGDQLQEIMDAISGVISNLDPSNKEY